MKFIKTIPLIYGSIVFGNFYHLYNTEWGYNLKLEEVVKQLMIIFIAYAILSIIDSFRKELIR